MLTGIIRGQRLMLRTPIVVADSINYLTAKFTFDPDWTGRTVTAYFVCGDKAITAELTDGEITAAQGINLTAGRWELKLSGIKGDSRVTAGPVQFDVLPFGATEGELPDISLTQYEQLLAKIGDMDELTTTDKDTLVAAINEAAQSGGSGGGELPAGGTPGQVLTWTANGSAWKDLPTYDGEITIIPQVENTQTLKTAGKYLEQDVQVKEIPQYSVSNDAGGTTFIIGKEL